MIQTLAALDRVERVVFVAGDRAGYLVLLFGITATYSDMGCDGQSSCLSVDPSSLVRLDDLEVLCVSASPRLIVGQNSPQSRGGAEIETRIRQRNCEIKDSVFFRKTAGRASAGPELLPRQPGAGKHDGHDIEEIGQHATHNRNY